MADNIPRFYRISLLRDFLRAQGWGTVYNQFEVLDILVNSGVTQYPLDDIPKVVRPVQGVERLVDAQFSARYNGLFHESSLRAFLAGEEGAGRIASGWDKYVVREPQDQRRQVIVVGLDDMPPLVPRAARGVEVTVSAPSDRYSGSPTRVSGRRIERKVIPEE